MADTTQHFLPTAMGLAARLTIAALQKRKVPPAPLLKRAGLLRGDIDDPHGRVSAAGQARFLEYAAAVLDDSALGLHLAEHANPKEAGLLFYAMSAARTLAEALTLFARYSRIANDSVRLRLESAEDGTIVDVSYVGIWRQHARQFTEFGMALSVKAFREMAGRKIRPIRVACSHGRNANLREFERFYGCAVEFGAPFDLMKFSDETLSTALVTHDPYLLETLRPFCDEAAAARSTPAGTLRAAVENEIQRLLPHGKAHAEIVAKSLAVSVRTLSRRLSEEGTSFVEIVDQLRHSLAIEYLKEPSFTIAQVTWLLGYEGTTSFNHAFKRWTGKASSAFRTEGSSVHRRAL